MNLRRYKNSSRNRYTFRRYLCVEVGALYEKLTSWGSISDEEFNRMILSIKQLRKIAPTRKFK